MLDLAFLKSAGLIASLILDFVLSVYKRVNKIIHRKYESTNNELPTRTVKYMNSYETVSLSFQTGSAKLGLNGALMRKWLCITVVAPLCL